MENNNHAYTDPLDELLKKHSKVINGDENVDGIYQLNQESTDTESNSQPVTIPLNNVTEDETTESLDFIDLLDLDAVEAEDYGDAELQEELDAEERALNAEKEERIRQYQENKAENNTTAKLAGRSLDPEFQEEAIGHQGKNIETVNSMMMRVLADNGIYDGYIPNEKRMSVMGELMEEYYLNGETPTEKFKKIVLDNWVNPNMSSTPNESQPEENETKHKDDDTQNEEPKQATPTININVKEDTPVTVNVDDSIIPNISETKEVNINIIEVENHESTLETVVENADVDAILSDYGTDINTVPVTLIRSGYRGVVKPINWFDYLKFAQPAAGNITDSMLERWHILYNHITSVSIGQFESFDDFLKKTKYEDEELLQWALFVATSSNHEMIQYDCGVEKCKAKINYEYEPRTIINIHEDELPSYYKDVYNASVGPQALEVFNKVSNKRELLTLPAAGFILEITRASVYEYITVKIPIIQEYCKKYEIPFENFEKHLSRNPVGALYILCALSLSSITIKKNGTDYKFTKWDDIEKIISKLTNDDIQVMLMVFEKRMTKPITFEFRDIKCPKCGHVTKVMPVDNIFELLGFNLTRRLQNTKVNLIETV